MSKKTRKTRQPNVPMQTEPTAPKAAAGGGTNPIKMTSRATAGNETINADYTHVFADLRRITVFAVVIFGGLIVLSFFIK